MLLDSNDTAVLTQRLPMSSSLVAISAAAPDIITRAQRFLSPHHALINCLAYGFMYAFLHITRLGQPKVKAHPVLALHITCSTLEAMRYYTSALYGPPIAGLPELATAVMTAITGLILVRNLRKYPRLMRPCFQTGAVFRPLLVLYAYLSGSSIAYGNAIAGGNGFVYSRWLGFLLRDAVRNPCDNYAISVFAASILGVCGMEMPALGGWTPHLFVGVVLAMARLNSWTSAQVAGQSGKGRMNAVVSTLLFLGFANVETLSASKHLSEFSKE